MVVVGDNGEWRLILASVHLGRVNEVAGADDTRETRAHETPTS
jgi:hypothetical protein